MGTELAKLVNVSVEIYHTAQLALRTIGGLTWYLFGFLVNFFGHRVIF